MIGKVKAETRDLAAGALLHNVFLPSQPIEDLIYLAPGTGVPTPSLALLVRGQFSYDQYHFKVVAADLLTGSKVDDWILEVATVP